MSALPTNPNLALLLPANKNWDFYAYDFNLSEGISQIPTGIVTLYSRDFMDMEDLNGYLDTLATVKVTQNHNGENVSRCFSGLITKVAHLGLMQENENGTTYGFRMTIQPAVVNLCYARHNYSLKDCTPREAIQTVMDGLMLNMDQLNDDNTPGLNTPSSFYQGKENDFQFLMRILETYGLNFCYRTPYTDTEPQMPTMYLNSAGVFSISGELSPDIDLNSPQEFHCRTRNPEHYAMTHWELDNQIGVDAVRVDYQSANAQALSQLSGDSQAKRLYCYNTSPFGMLTQDDIEQKTNNHLGKLNLAKHVWQGSTGCLVAMPGVAVDVKEFYGKKNDTTISAVILYANLYCRAPMPDSILQFDEAQPATCEIKIDCIDRTKPAELGAAITASQQEKQQANSLIVGAAGANIDNSSSSTTNILDSSNSAVMLQAVVCDASGNTSSSNSYSTLSQNNLDENRYTFTAKLLSGSNTSTPVDVWLVMPLGGFGQGLFRVPRQGEYILVAQNAGTNEYYLLGYLPNGNMPFASKANYSAETDPDTKESNSLNSATVLRFSQTSANSSVPSYVSDDDAILPKRVTIHSGGSPRYSEIGFYTSYASTEESSSSSYNSVPDTGDAVPQVYNGDTETQITENINIQAPNTIDLTAGDAININSPSITLSGQKDGSCKGSSLTIGNFEKVNIVATEKISLTVGQCQVKIDQDSVSLTAARWSTVSGPLTSSIKMTAMSGVSISGMSTKISGAYNVGLSDGSGGSLSISTGSIKGTGCDVCFATMKGLTYGFQNALTGGNILLELVGFAIDASCEDTTLENYETVCKIVQNAAKLASTCINSVTNIKKLHDDYIDIHKNHKDDVTRSNVQNLNIAKFAFELAATIVEMILGIIKNADPDWLSQQAGANITNRDCFRLTCMSLYTIGWTLGVIAGIIKVNWQSTAKVELIGANETKYMTKSETSTQIKTDINTAMDANGLTKI